MNNRPAILTFLLDIAVAWTLLLQIPFIPNFIKVALVVTGAAVAAHAMLSLWHGSNFATDLVDYEPDDL